MGLSLVELSLGRYPIPPPQPDELRQIFGTDALQEHLEAAKTGRSLRGGCCWNLNVVVFHIFCFREFKVFAEQFVINFLALSENILLTISLLRLQQSVCQCSTV